MSIAENLTAIAENVPKVYEAGKKAEYNEFWDNFKVDSQYAFAGQGWTKNTFKPNRNFTVRHFTFFYHNWMGAPYDLAEHLENLGVKMTMGSGAIQQSFRVAWFTRLPELDFSKLSGYYDRVFSSAGNSPLVTIDKIILPPEGSVTTFYDLFYMCSSLKNITFEGVLDKSISFSYSPLTVASLKNIISCLKDYSTEAPFTYTLTLKDSCKTELEADTETVEFNGQKYTYFELITAKGWNLA